MKKYLLVVLASVVFLCLRANSAEIDSFVIVYGEKHVYTIVLPKGWSLDKELAQEHELGTFMYPEIHGDRQQIPTYIHSTGYDKIYCKDKSLASFVEADQNTILKRNNVKISKVGEVNTYNSGKAVIYRYLYVIDKSKIKQTEYVAFIDTPTAFCNVTFSTDNAEDLSKYDHVFNLVVSSFNYLGDDIKKAKSKLPH